MKNVNPRTEDTLREGVEKLKEMFLDKLAGHGCYMDDSWIYRYLCELMSNHSKMELDYIKMKDGLERIAKMDEFSTLNSLADAVGVARSALHNVGDIQ